MTDQKPTGAPAPVRAPVAAPWGNIGPTAHDTARALITFYEGCRTHAYNDAAGVLTIGYGHTGPDVHAGQTATREQISAWLAADMGGAFEDVARCVAVPINDNQTAALVSFVFNLGAARLQMSNLLHLLNAGDYAGAADQFPLWVYADGERLPGLITRRDSERTVFLTPAA